MNDRFITDWLERRKISPAIQTEFCVRAGRTSTLGECIVIPILTETGAFCYNKYRRSPLSDTGPKYTYDKGASMMLFGAHKAATEPKVVWCEGELDALVCWSANIPAVSSTGGAQSIDESWVKFFEGKEVIICFDNDPAGGEGAYKALKLIPWAKILFLPEGIKDISEYTERGGNLNELIGTAVRLNSDSDVVNDMKERQALFKKTYFHESYFKHKEAEAVEKKRADYKGANNFNGDMLERARSVPIDSLLQFDSRGAAKCLWHAETEGSLHYYKDSNRCWCFGGCGKGYDAVDVYMKIHGVSFKEALRRM